ncbi:hypothetical protein AGMMS49944_01850 [Spirochaetia bacterium]|nr:hypothetical protein AGMMS49944_01850 [Spirochaetia bacterium]
MTLKEAKYILNRAGYRVIREMIDRDVDLRSNRAAKDEAQKDWEAIGKRNRAGMQTAEDAIADYHKNFGFAKETGFPKAEILSYLDKFWEPGDNIDEMVSDICRSVLHTDSIEDIDDSTWDMLYATVEDYESNDL